MDYEQEFGDLLLTVYGRQSDFGRPRVCQSG